MLYQAVRPSPPGAAGALLAAIGHAMANGATPLTWGLDPVWVWQTRGIVFALIGAVFLVVLARAGFASAGGDPVTRTEPAHDGVIVG
jgi:hypothetical protein